MASLASYLGFDYDKYEDGFEIMVELTDVWIDAAQKAYRDHLVEQCEKYVSDPSFGE